MIPQIDGYRAAIDFDDWTRLNLAHIDTWSLRLDVQFLLRTVPVVLTARGAHYLLGSLRVGWIVRRVRLSGPT